MRRPNLQTSAVVVVGLLSAVVAAASGRSARLRELKDSSLSSAVVLPDSTLLARFSGGYSTLLSDYYWLAAIQYYGTAENSAGGFKDLSRILELVTDLDPSFAYAYRFGGVTIPNAGRSGWMWTDEAIHLVRKGTRNCPDNWQIGALLGFLQIWHRNEPLQAAEALENAARQPDAPRYLALLATRLRAHAGAPLLGLKFAHELLAQTTDPELKAELQQRVADLETEVILQQVDAAVARYKHEKGEFPSSLEVLVSEKFLPSLPPQILGPETHYDAPTGRIWSDRQPARLRLSEWFLIDAKSHRQTEASP